MKNLTAKSRTQLANEYGIDRKTLNSRLKKAGIELPKGAIMPKDLRKIFKCFGQPNVIGSK